MAAKPFLFVLATVARGYPPVNIGAWATVRTAKRKAEELSGERSGQPGFVGVSVRVFARDWRRPDSYQGGAELYEFLIGPEGEEMWPVDLHERLFGRLRLKSLVGSPRERVDLENVFATPLAPGEIAALLA